MSARVNILGGGWSGLTIGYLLELLGYEPHVYEKEATLGGHARSITVQGVVTEAHGPHYFHTSEEWLWRWATSMTKFRFYVPWARAVTDYGTFPWPMTTEAIERHPKRDQIRNELTVIAKKKAEGKFMGVGPNGIQIPAAFAVEPIGIFQYYLFNTIGPTLYETFVDGYTTKMWGNPGTLDLSFAPKRIEFREDNNANYFKDTYQGVPVMGYNAIYTELAKRLTVHTKTRAFIDDAIPTFITTSPDDLLDFKHGKLPYRSLKFHFDVHTGYQEGHVLEAPQMNFTSESVPYTRKTEPRWYTGQPGQDVDGKSVVVTEYPGGTGQYYPVPTTEAQEMYAKYKADLEAPKRILAGRLGSYKYLNMNEVIEQAFETVARFAGKDVSELIALATKDREGYDNTVL